MQEDEDIQISLDVAGDAEEEEPQYTQVEQDAMAMGWRPQEEYEGNPDNWRTAKEFVDRQSLYAKISNQGREIKKTQEALQLLVEHNQKLTTAQKEAERNRLEHEKIQALDEQDFHRASNIDTELRTLEPTEDDLLELPTFEDTEDSELFQEFKTRNSWYDPNSTNEVFNEMSAVADGIAKAFVAFNNNNNRNFSEEDVYRHVEKKMPQHFPDHFGNKTRKKPGSLGNNSRNADAEQTNRGKSKYTERDLNAQQKEIMKTFVAAGALTKQEYIDQLAELGEL